MGRGARLLQRLARRAGAAERLGKHPDGPRRFHDDGNKREHHRRLHDPPDRRPPAAARASMLAILTDGLCRSVAIDGVAIRQWRLSCEIGGLGERSNTLAPLPRQRGGRGSTPPRAFGRISKASFHRGSGFKAVRLIRVGNVGRVRRGLSFFFVRPRSPRPRSPWTAAFAATGTFLPDDRGGGPCRTSPHRDLSRGCTVRGRVRRPIPSWRSPRITRVDGLGLASGRV